MHLAHVQYRRFLLYNEIKNNRRLVSIRTDRVCMHVAYPHPIFFTPRFLKLPLVLSIDITIQTYTSDPSFFLHTLKPASTRFRCLISRAEVAYGLVDLTLLRRAWHNVLSSWTGFCRESVINTTMTNSFYRFLRYLFETLIAYVFIYPSINIFNERNYYQNKSNLFDIMILFASIQWPMFLSKKLSI